MARLTACFALSAVLVLATGICSVTGQLNVETGVDKTCTSKLLPFSATIRPACDFSAVPPMKIISKANTTLNVAANSTAATANETNQVFLAENSCTDPAQAWIKFFPVQDRPEEFALVNTINPTQEFNLQQLVMNVTEEPIRRPDDGSIDPKGLVVKLVPFKGSANTTMLWKQVNVEITDENGITKNDSFYKIESVKYATFYLDALLFNDPSVHVGTVVGAYSDTHNNTNVLWQIIGSFSPSPA